MKSRPGHLAWILGKVVVFDLKLFQLLDSSELFNIKQYI